VHDITTEAQLRALLGSRHRPPWPRSARCTTWTGSGLAFVVEVEEVFHHCAKAFLRSEPWDPSSWRPHAVDSRAKIAHRLERRGEQLADIERYYGEQYSAGLYPAP
jgi:hypothetical protein